VTDGTSRPAGRVHRLHGSTLVFDVGRRFASFAFVGLAAVFFAARRAELWYLAFLLPPVVQALLRYVSFRYTFTPEHLVIREGVFVRSVRHVPYTRVQNIDTLQGPLHRLLDVVEVRLETAGGSEPEALFRVISSAQLGELRAHVFAARGHADEANARPGEIGVDVGVKAHRDGLIQIPVRRSFGALRGAAVAGDLTEQPVKRHRGGGQPEHADDHARECYDRQGLAANPSPAHVPAPLILTMVIR
jgi:membrane protein YdbS with pleckstrin-like domain